jgi:hypothetical protein
VTLRQKEDGEGEGEEEEELRKTGVLGLGPHHTLLKCDIELN